MKKSFNKFSSILPIFDIFGQKVELYIDSKNSVKSRIGGFFTILVIVLFFYSFGNSYVSWINGEKLSTVSAYRSFTADYIVKEQPINLYTFNSSNYYIYFVLKAVQENGTYLFNSELQRYFNYVLTYEDQFEQKKTVELEYCSLRKTNDFLLMSNDGVNNDSQVNTKRVCIKDGQNIQMGWYYSETQGQIFIPFLRYAVEKCVNSSMNNFSCASEEEINKIIKSTDVQVSLPKSIYDFSDIASPRKRAYDYKIYKLDEPFSSLYQNYLFSNYLCF